MEDAGDGIRAARMRSDTGVIDIETRADALITGVESGNATVDAVRIVSREGKILDAGDTRLDIVATATGSQLTMVAAQGIGENNPLEIDVRNLSATSAGGIELTDTNSLNIVGVTAGDRIRLNAGGDLTGKSVSSTGAGTNNLDQTVQLFAQGAIKLEHVSGKSDVSLSAQNDVSVDVLTSSAARVCLLARQAAVSMPVARRQRLMSSSIRRRLRSRRIAPRPDAMFRPQRRTTLR